MDRREFLKQSGVIVAGATLLPAVCVAAPALAPPERGERLRTEYTLHLRECYSAPATGQVHKSALFFWLEDRPYLVFNAVLSGSMFGRYTSLQHHTYRMQSEWGCDAALLELRTCLAEFDRGVEGGDRAVLERMLLGVEARREALSRVVHSGPTRVPGTYRYRSGGPCDACAARE